MTSTVYDLFLKAIGQLGLPSRVRSNQGGENVVVAQNMVERKGSDRERMITGSSTQSINSGQTKTMELMYKP